MSKDKKFKKNKKKPILSSQQSVTEDLIVEEQKLETPITSQEELEREEIFLKLQAEISENQKAIDEGRGVDLETVKANAARELQEIEAPKVGRKNSGRRPRKTYEGLEVSFNAFSTKDDLHGKEALEVTYKLENEEELLELVVRQYLSAHHIHDDMAPRILNYLWSNARNVDNRQVYISKVSVVARDLNLSYPSVQKVVKKLIANEIIVKESFGYAFTELSASYLNTLFTNKQIVLSFEVKK
jgi:hypothetical protein